MQPNTLDLSQITIGPGTLYGPGLLPAITPPAPKLIAICGAPKAGKTTVAEFLRDRYGVEIVDDGMTLRRACYTLFGGKMEDYTTQEGKARSKTVCGRTLTNRELLGELGNHLEAWFGEQIMPELALAGIGAKPGSWKPGFVFPSCRKTQGITYQSRGGFVIEVSRPGCEPVHDFDHYDKSLVNYTIENNGTMGHLLGQVIDIAEKKLGLVPIRQDRF